MAEGYQDIPKKPLKNVISYAFPTSLDGISGNNNYYTVTQDGFAIFVVVFSDSNYSQVGLVLNGNKLSGANITSGGVNLKWHSTCISFPVCVGDVLYTTYYNDYTVASAGLYIYY